MSQFKLERYLLIIATTSLLFAIVLNQGGQCEPSSLEDSIEIQNVLNKLEKYSAGLLGDSSGLTIKELERAYLEFRAWSPERRKTLRQSQPLVHLLSDFVFVPMGRFEKLIGTSLEDSNNYPAYIKRLENGYKRFRPAYLGKKMKIKRLSRAKSIDKALQSLLGLKNSVPLTWRLLDAAKMDYKIYLGRINELGTVEDIYSSFKELERLFNYINLPEVQIFADKISPLISDDGDRSDEKLNELKAIFKDEFAKRNMIVKEGKLVRINQAN